MSLTLGHFFVLMALVELVVLWKVTGDWRTEDDRKPEAERCPASLIMAAAVLSSLGLVALGLLHPIGDMPLFEI
ncbi:MAG TPA: hypothetical protein VGB59_01585 [Allosphingosinicella sp.]|jgi:hypothetical protein